MDAIDLFLRTHARLHSASVVVAEASSMEDDILDGLDEERVRHRPEGMNPLAWVFWHMARVEDVAVNVVATDGSQVLDDGWTQRLRVPARDIGTEMTDEQVAELAGAIDVGELRRYRASVGARTRSILADMDAGLFDATVDPAGAEWVGQIWQGTTLGFLFARAAIVHNALHIGEAQIIASRV